MPIGAICAKEEVSKAFSAGSTGTTFGDILYACAAALAEVNELLGQRSAETQRRLVIISQLSLRSFHT